jgi:hypothetical protein
MVREYALGHRIHKTPGGNFMVSNSSEGHLVVTVVTLVIASILAVAVAILDHLNVVGTIAREKGVVGIVIFQVTGCIEFCHGIIHLGMVVAFSMSVIIPKKEGCLLSSTTLDIQPRIHTFADEVICAVFQANSAVVCRHSSDRESNSEDAELHVCDMRSLNRKA